MSTYNNCLGAFKESVTQKKIIFSQNVGTKIIAFTTNRGFSFLVARKSYRTICHVTNYSICASYQNCDKKIKIILLLITLYSDHQAIVRHDISPSH